MPRPWRDEALETQGIGGGPLPSEESRAPDVLNDGESSRYWQLCQEAFGQARKTRPLRKGVVAKVPAV